MENYATVLNYGILFFVTLISIEFLYGLSQGKKTIRAFDTISSLSSGVTNIIKDVVGFTITIVGYAWMQSHIAIFEIKASWLAYVITFITMDFAGYWMHRYEHKINILWNNHVIHHSSEEYNLPCALRQEVSKFFSFYGILMIPIAIIGVPVEVLAVVAPLHLFAQFWYHTQLIGKMGWLEYVLVTPSHHRVHHAMNDKYMDKNFSQIFIVWDRLFGTFQVEEETLKPVFGVKRAVKTWNPFLINFQHLSLIVKDAIRTKSIKDKFRIWFMPTGWRPSDVEAAYPVPYIKDVNNFDKYEVEAPMLLKIWSWSQLLITLGLMLYLFNNMMSIAAPQIMLYGLFLLVSVFSYTALMDQKKYTILAEGIKVVLGIILIYLNSGWFGIDHYLSFGTYIIIGYLAVSFTASFYFVKITSNSAVVSELKRSF